MFEYNNIFKMTLSINTQVTQNEQFTIHFYI
jgi:hypothetical protein